MRDGLSDSIPVEALAALAGQSVGHFCRMFGASPHNHIVRMRIDAAKAMIVQSGKPLSDIALECGFSDRAHLCKLFRRRVGCTPGEWRRAGVVDPHVPSTVGDPGHGKSETAIVVRHAC